MSICVYMPPQIISNEKPETTVKIFNSADLQCPDVIWSTHYRLICQGTHSPVRVLRPMHCLGPWLISSVCLWLMQRWCCRTCPRACRACVPTRWTGLCPWTSC